MSGSNGDDKRLIIAGFGLFAFLGFLLLLNLATRFGPSNQASQTTTTSSADRTTTTEPSRVGSLIDSYNTTTTVNKNDAPEASRLDEQQLKHSYTQKDSGLKADVYDKGVRAAEAFARADVTGVGTGDFATYFSNTRPKPWMDDFHLQHVTVQTTRTPNAIKALVWFDGTQKFTKVRYSQIQYGFYPYLLLASSNR